MSRWQQMAAPLVAAAALGYLAAMVATGAQPVQRQLVRFEAKGVLKVPPERIRRVELRRRDARIELVRVGEKSWSTDAGTEIAAEAGKRVSMAVQMMHTSGPVREIPAAELAGIDAAPFGLESPRIEARLYEDGETPVLTARFGERNPDDFLQYMRVDGDPRLFLISRFVGEEWTAAMDGVLGR